MELGGFSKDQGPQPKKFTFSFGAPKIEQRSQFEGSPVIHAPARPQQVYQRPQRSPPRGERPDLYPSENNKWTSAAGHANFIPQQRIDLVNYSDIHDDGKFYPPKPYAGTTNMARSPPMNSVAFGSSSSQNSGRSELFPSKTGNQKRSPVRNATSPPDRFNVVDYSDLHDEQMLSTSIPSTSVATKKAKSPSVPPAFGPSSLQINPGRSDVFPPVISNQRRSPTRNATSPPRHWVDLDHTDLHHDQTHFEPKPSTIVATKRAKSPIATKRAKSPPEPAATLGHSTRQDNTDRVNLSPFRPGNHRKSPLNYATSPAEQMANLVDYSDIHDEDKLSDPKPSSTPTKRARSPQSTSVALSSSSFQNDSEKEIQAKAKRLARFGKELDPPLVNLPQVPKSKTSEDRQTGASGGNQTVYDEHTKETLDFQNRLNSFETEGAESSSLVIGLCPDMCPDLEREERERKGDLDKYERLDGDRNQSSKFLAVKKYTRTAEREPELIRPMLVLQKTINYLLTLLDQPYDDNFLGIYNFLWDRMRAVRMDLRMQHIFNREAITMLEQMIRLHIIAMYELCEYNKGEGFSEGFDAHLNIEQMNKTSVELFQMYDDHRKKGITVPTEKEFRGYYALLKLDKHPGYKVEPAELSVDLAKMTPEIRCTPDILFAREVARACRVGNFIAFFRLTRKATYLQACLMHAHFSKLRTQALASLHSGLQNNQGIPVSSVANWLGMEDEDIESLLEYHGFGMKKFEEVYMVKEGPFLKADVDFPTKRSQLVELKKSLRIVDDIFADQSKAQLPEKEDADAGHEQVHPPSMDTHASRIWLNAGSREVNAEVNAVKADSSFNPFAQSIYQSSEVANGFKTVSSLTGFSQPNWMFKEPAPPSNKGIDTWVSEAFIPGANSVCSVTVVNDAPEDEHMVELQGDSFFDQHVLSKGEVNTVLTASPKSACLNGVCEILTPQVDEAQDSDNGSPALAVSQRNEIAINKLKHILRKWKNQAAKQRKIREDKVMLADAALASLSLGPPVRLGAIPPQVAEWKLSIDYAARERYTEHMQSWTAINISSHIAPILQEKNPDSKCLCWKLLICFQGNNEEHQTNFSASRWLRWKLFGSSKENEKPLVSLPHLAIWERWYNSETSPQDTCCLSVVREARFQNNQLSADDLPGTTSIMFLVSECIPWEVQRSSLGSLLKSIPPGSNLPLLLVTGDAFKDEDMDQTVIIGKLGLQDLEDSRISMCSVLFLCGNDSQKQPTGQFKDDSLKEGLKWLAHLSPKQPCVSLEKTREVVLAYLRSSQETFDHKHPSKVDPSNCISTFNEALEKLAENIVATASMNPNKWPCPEIDLLEKSSNERVFVETFLPDIDWSSSTRVEQLTRAIRGCKLPEFSIDISSLNQGSQMGLQIPYHKFVLEECLIRYMTESCHLLNTDLAAREASIMVQTGADLELHGSSYYIIPRWLTIFRRIQNWQLMKLTAGEFSVAYLLEQHLDTPFEQSGPVTPLKPTCVVEMAPDTVRVEGHVWHYTPSKLSLDEAIEITSNASFTEHLSSVPSGIPSPDFNDGGTVLEINKNNFRINEEDFDNNPPGMNEHDLNRQVNSKEQTLGAPVFKVDFYELDTVVEKCKRVQDYIDKQLCIYYGI